MKILISGPSGLIGQTLIPILQSEGHTVAGLSRRARAPGDIVWSPESDDFDADLSDFDAIIHLAGESVAGGRWTPKRRKSIRASRVKGTDLLARSAAAARNKAKANGNPDGGPKIFLSASAIGYYGEGGDTVLTEAGPVGAGFLADVVNEWEQSTAPAEQAGLRVAHLRIGLVLATDGGALGAMLPVFRLGGGGRLGSGKQWMSWIAIQDVCNAIRHILTNDSIQGPVNLTAPRPVTNNDFTRSLGQVLGRPTLLPAPAFALRLALGKQMAEEMLLTSTRVAPEVLEKTGFSFQFPELEGALRSVLNRPA